MKSLLTLLSALFLASIIYSQNLQSSNSLRKSRMIDSNLVLGGSIIVPQLSTGYLSLPEIISQDQKMDFKSLQQKLSNTSNDAMSLLETLENSDLSKQEKKNIKATVTEIEENNQKLDDIRIQLKDSVSEEEKNYLMASLQKISLELEEKNAELNKYAENYKEQLKTNEILKRKIMTLSSAIKSLQKQMKSKIDALNTQVAMLSKTNYFLSLELISNKTIKLKENAETLNTKLSEIKINFEKLTWLQTVNMSPEDRKIVEQMNYELRDEWKKGENAKHNLAVLIEINDSTLQIYKTFGPILTSGLDIPATYSANTIEPAKKIALENYNTANASFEKYKTALTGYADKYEKTVLIVNPRIEKYKIIEKKEENFSALGGFKKILQEDGAFIPDINILANKKFGTQDFGGYGQIRLFTGLNTDNGSYNTSLNYFVPEASTYGLAMDFGLGFQLIKTNESKSENIKNRINDFGINTSFYFLGKKLRPKDSVSITSNIVHWKTGIEILPFQNFVSLRCNLNGLFISNKYSQIKSFYNSSSDTKWFTDLALSTLLNLNEDKNYKLRFELDIIFTNGDLKDFINTSDKLLPQIKLELVKGF